MDCENIKKTPLCAIHEKLGGRMVDFGGWYMPVQYTGIVAEHTAVRNHAGIFDISHMGEFEVSGQKAFDFIQHMVTNDISTMQDGRVLYSPVCNDTGGIVDDILIYRFNRNQYMLVVNAANIKKDFSWFNGHLPSNGVTIKDYSDSYVLIALQGPAAESIMHKHTAHDLTGLNYYWFIEDSLNGIPVILSRTGYTGEDGFEIFVPKEFGEKIWHMLTLPGSGGVTPVPVGLGARDSLRLEASYSLYGHELTDEITPLEAGLGWTVKIEKKDFIGKQILREQKNKGLRKTLVCFTMDETGIPRQGYTVQSHADRKGWVTSGTFSPTFKKGIGMAYVNAQQLEPGTKLRVMIRDKEHAATVVKRPFYKRVKS
ncbi:MAG: glycine cleavage system aminomethyltransferase GcvT [Elusimicrobia bacterium]|nr:glycine cleavage system aminomethyltransferase GcvT [Elusimicrobiota bacterium]MBD3411918.1 glycine cleavage system aminomethyltransferase GcvT [Elusimicrobiota bacterium]